MAINLPQNLQTQIDDLYRKEIISYGGADLASKDSKWVGDPGISGALRTDGIILATVMDPGFELDRVSYYLKKEGSNFNASSAEKLFRLTKMLGTPTSDVFSIKRRIMTNMESDAFSTLAQQHVNVVGRQFPSGASTEDKRKIYKEKIYPGILDNYVAAIKDTSLDPVIARLIKEWWSTSQDEIFNNYLKIADGALGKGVYSAAEIDKGETKSGGSLFKTRTAFGESGLYVGSATANVKSDFFSAIVRPGNTFLKNATVLYSLGLSEELSRLNKVAAVGGTRYSPASNVAELEALKISDPEKFARIVEAALALDSNLTAEDLANLDQCALITALVHNEPKFGFRHYITAGAVAKVGGGADNQYKSPLEKGKKGDERIYPVQIDNYNPNKLINNCVINKDIKGIFNTKDTKTPHNMVKALFWVYEGTDGGLREAELSTNSMVHRKKINTLFQELKAEDSLDPNKSRFMKIDRLRDSSYYFLDNTKITFDGTNPSTARNDVKIEMSWKLGSLEGLDSTMAILGTDDKLPPETTVAIKDLITLPVTKKPSSSDGPGQFITNQYSPNYSRLRLKVAPYGDEPDKDGRASHQKDCMILDLAVIDHQINRSSETGETTLTINYRGYFEATLNMPFNDVLATEELREVRAKRQKEGLDKLEKENCSAETVREALRLEQEIYRAEVAQSSAGSILLRMQLLNLIHSYELDDDLLKAGTFGNVLDGTMMYVKEVSPGAAPTITKNDLKNLAKSQKEKDGKKDEEQEILREASKGLLDKKFFFLGDLMWVLLGCLYKPNSVKHLAAVKNLNLRFIIGSIYIPDPKNLGGAPSTINPISAPIDLKFFVQWFDATIVSKGLTIYPVGTFVRDLIERLVNDIIYDTCFSLFLPDENPPLLRSRTFVSSNKDWFAKDWRGWFDPDDPHQNRLVPSPLFQKNFISTHTDGKTWSQKVSSKNYCVIYQQFPSYKRQLAVSEKGTLKEDEYTPTIYYGAKNKNYNFLSNVSFAKTNSPYLREARYFNTDYGGLSLLSNVYDLSFSFKRRKANIMFYPGCIINFVLVDWGTRWVDEPPWTTNTSGSIVHSLGVVPNTKPEGFQYKRLGASDPHEEGTMSNIMGMGGYFIIKSVEYNLGQTPGEFEINISTKFLGTDAYKPPSRFEGQDKRVSDSAACNDAYGVIASRFNELVSTGDIDSESVRRADRSAEEAAAIVPTVNLVGELLEGERETIFTITEDSMKPAEAPDAEKPSGNTSINTANKAAAAEQKAMEETKAWLEGVKK